MKKHVLIVISIIISIAVSAQNEIEKGLNTINIQSAEAYIGFLASDVVGGRAAGGYSSLISAEYIKSVFQDMNLKPFFGDSYFMPFEAYRIEGGRGYVIDADMIEMYRKNDAVLVKSDMYNVGAYIEGERADEYVVIGAHYDHLGTGRNIGSDSIFNGADDNASGVSAVLQIAKAFKESGKKPLRTVVFLLWDGEEYGLLGSKFFVRNWENIDKVKSYLNFDMIGRVTNPNNPKHVEYSYSVSVPIFGDWLKNDINDYQLNLEPKMVHITPQSRYGGSDYAPFLEKGIPAIWYFTGLHPDYHRPSDEVDKIEWEHLIEVTKAGFLTAWKMVNEEYDRK